MQKVKAESDICPTFFILIFLNKLYYEEVMLCPDINKNALF
jgi:hypothetical protein